MLYKDKTWLEEMYKEYGSSHIAKICNVDDKTIIYWLKKYNIKIRTRSESLKITKSRKYHLNEDYFKNIDSSEKAYFLGLLMADGTMREHKNSCYQLSLELKQDDKYIIDIFNNCIESNYKVVISNNSNYNSKRARLIITNFNFASNLLNHGVVPHKTGKETVPLIDANFNKDFIRGFFDGDGSIQFTDTGKRVRSRFHLVSCSYNVLFQIKSILESEANVIFTEKSIHLKSNTSNIYELETSTLPEIAKIYDYLYYDKCLHLKRKELIFNTFLQYYKTSSLLIKRYSPNH